MPEFGPYEQPGWPSTLPYFQPGKTFQSAVGITSEINRRKQQLENQLQMMAIRNQNQEFMQQLKERDFERKAGQFQQMMAWREHESNMKDMVTNWKFQKDQETMSDIAGLAQGLGAIDLPPDDPNRPNAIYDLISKNSRAVHAAPRLIQDAFNNYNTAARTAGHKFDGEYNAFLKDVKSTIGRGQSTDLDPLYHPEIWKTEWIDKEGNTHAPPVPDKEGNLPDYVKTEGWKPTTQKYITVPNTDPTKPPVFVKLPAQKLTDMMKQLKSLDERRANLPQQVNNEYAVSQYDRVGNLPQPSASDIAYLKSHPEKRAAFDSRFGAGTSSQIIGQ